MKPTMIELNSILFEQIERLNDDSLKGDELKEQIEKSKTIQKISSVMVSNAAIIVEAAKLKSEGFDGYGVQVPKMIGLDDK